MSKKTLVTFTPLEPYLFGSELTHGNGDGANYFSKGNPLPQQTTICGTLRHLLLKSGFSRGLNSFTPDDPKLNDYGDLLRCSPLFLTDGREFFLREAIDRHDRAPLDLSAEQANEWTLFDSGDPENANSGWQNARRWTGLDPKKDLVDSWVSPGSTKFEPDEIFKIFIRPGIPKKELRRPSAKGPGLFKQQLYRLAKDWKFCVLAEFSDRVDPTKLDGATLPVGAEKSVFHISVKDENRDFEGFFPPGNMFYQKKPAGGPRLVLTSDAWVSDEVWKHAVAASTETVDFRHIRTHATVEKYGRLHRWKNDEKDPENQLAKSPKYTLLRRGSVLICRDVDDALTELEKALKIAPWHGIGFNHFFTYP